VTVPHPTDQVITSPAAFPHNPWPSRGRVIDVPPAGIEKLKLIFGVLTTEPASGIERQEELANMRNVIHNLNSELVDFM
jgi:hypothetical protein